MKVVLTHMSVSADRAWKALTHCRRTEESRCLAHWLVSHDMEVLVHSIGLQKQITPLLFPALCAWFQERKLNTSKVCKWGDVIQKWETAGSFRLFLTLWPLWCRIGCLHTSRRCSWSLAKFCWNYELWHPPRFTWRNNLSSAPSASTDARLFNRDTRAQIFPFGQSVSTRKSCLIIIKPRASIFPSV